MRRPASGPRIDRAKVKTEQRLDAKYLLSTSDPDLSAADVALAYKNLLEAETWLTRPHIHPRAAPGVPPACPSHPRPRAAVLAALLLIRVAERSTSSTWRRIATDPRPRPQGHRRLRRRHRHGHHTLSDTHKGLVRACNVAPPPRITHLNPA